MSRTTHWKGVNIETYVVLVRLISIVFNILFLIKNLYFSLEWVNNPRYVLIRWVLAIFNTVLIKKNLTFH
jgi:hypothetical protein